jgi:DNA topoisomerase-1
MKLVLVESPTKARKLTGYLGSDYVVRASIGHIRDLPKSKMGIDIDHGFKPEYLVPKDKIKVVKELKSLAKNADQIILATDPDREGEAIGWHLREILSEGAKQAPDHFVRATFHEITKSAILDAIAHPIKLNMDLVLAQQARRVLDRLVGYSVSPVLWKKIRYGLSAGRVQSVALRLIVEREREIEAFKPEEYWEVDVLLDTNIAKNEQSKKTDPYFKENKIDQIPLGMLVARVTEVNGSAYDPKAASDVHPILEHLHAATFAIQSVEKKERRRASLPPFTTSTLQQQSANRFGYTSKNTMRLAQQLYEEGLITYHRTDSVNLSAQSLEMSRTYITKNFGSQYLPAQARIFTTTSKNAQEAHEAIRPTEIGVMADGIRGKLTEQHVKVYDLIWRRFVASQMESAVYDQTTVLIEAKTDVAGQPTELTLKSSGSILKFDGWMKLFPNQGDVLLPDVAPKQPLAYVEQNAAQKFTLPPPRFNDASLIKTLEKEGIGRPSTYASIISVIEDRGYVERKEKKFFPTSIGLAVNDFLMKYFQTIVDYHFTATMEDDLDAIARGEKEWQKIVALFYDPLAKTVAQVLETAERAQVPVEKTGVACPKCGASDRGEIVIRTGRFGKFKSCSRFPECDFTENIVNKVEGVICPLCQKGDVVIKPTRYGRDFYSCSTYPACDWASWSKPLLGTTLTAALWEQMKKERAERKKIRDAKFAKNAETKETMVKKSAKSVRTVAKKTKRAAPKKKKTVKRKTSTGAS